MLHLDHLVAAELDRNLKFLLGDHFRILAGDGDEIGIDLFIIRALRTAAEGQIHGDARINRLVGVIPATGVHIDNFARIGDVLDSLVAIKLNEPGSVLEDKNVGARGRIGCPGGARFLRAGAAGNGDCGEKR